MQSTEQPSELSEKETYISPLEIGEKTREELSALFHGEKWNGEKLPPVFLKFYFGPHWSAEDADGIKPFLNEADIFMPEASEWNDDYFREMNYISRGVETPESRDEYEEEIRRDIFGTEKVVLFVDCSEKDVILHPELYAETKDIDNELKHSTYDRATELNFQNAMIEAQIDIVNRESYMIEHFAGKVREAILQKPALKSKESIRVLMTIGSAHTEIYQKMKNLGGDHISREFRYTPSADFTDEMMRKAVFNKKIEKNTKERALFHFLMEEGLQDRIDLLSEKTVEHYVFLRHLSSLFSADEMRSLFDQWKSSPENFSERILLVLEKKGIHFPKTKKEFEDFIAKTQYGKYQRTLREINQNKQNEREK
jgi:hypothetical protein